MNTKNINLSTQHIHPDFKLAGQRFTSPESLLSFVKRNFREHFIFLKNWFDENNVVIAKTSGSTGIPKNIKLTKEAMLASAEATGIFFDLGAKSCVLHCLSSEFIAGKMQWVRALHLGWQLTVVPIDANPLAQTKKYFDFAAMVPLQAQNSLPELKRINQLLIGGAPLSYDLENQLKKLPSAIFQSYGMTETITHIAIKNLKDTEAVYWCLPNIEVSQNEDDCLIIQAPRISEHHIKTNDVVQLLSNTSFQWLGRVDHVINAGGYKIHPEILEKKLTPFIETEFFIIGKPDIKFDFVPVLVMEDSNSKLDFEDIFQKAGLHRYEKPKEIIFIVEFSRTPNGKINREATYLNGVE